MGYSNALDIAYSSVCLVYSNTLDIVVYFYTVAFIRILSMAYHGVRMLCVVFYRIKVLSVMSIR